MTKQQMDRQRQLGGSLEAAFIGAEEGAEPCSNLAAKSFTCIDPRQQVEEMEVDDLYPFPEAEIKIGIPETGEGTGTYPIPTVPSSTNYSSLEQPMEVDDIYSKSAAISETGVDIPKTGEETGTRPFQSDPTSKIVSVAQPVVGMKGNIPYFKSVTTDVSFLPSSWRVVFCTYTLLLALLAKGGRQRERDDFYRDSRERRSIARWRLLQLLIENPFPYIKAGGLPEFCPFTNTCVVNSFLAALHTTSIVSPDLEDLFNKNDFFKEVMYLLNKKFYNKARYVFIQELNPGKLDLFGFVSDYLPLLHKLVYSEQKRPPNNSSIYNTLLRTLGNCGEVIVLGEQSDPALILVHNEVGILNTELPSYITDEKNRIFLHQFSLIGKDKHMTMCFQSAENKWHVYDDDPKKPSFEPFLLESLQNYIICLVGYINITRVKEYYPGISETGKDTGPSPFYSDASSSSCVVPVQPVKDVEMEDLCSCSVAESGEGPINGEIVYC